MCRMLRQSWDVLQFLQFQGLTCSYTWSSSAHLNYWCPTGVYSAVNDASAPPHSIRLKSNIYCRKIKFAMNNQWMIWINIIWFNPTFGGETITNLWYERWRSCIISQPSACKSTAAVQIFCRTSKCVCVCASACTFSALHCACVSYLFCVLRSHVYSCVCVCVREIVRYLASLLPLFVWLQAFRLSVRGLCSETKHVVVSVTSLAAGTQHSEAGCSGAACNSPHFGSSNWHLGPESLWGYWNRYCTNHFPFFFLVFP